RALHRARGLLQSHRPGWREGAGTRPGSGRALGRAGRAAFAAGPAASQAAAHAGGQGRLISPVGGEPRSSAAGERFVVVGRVRGVHGLRGWLRVESYTRPAENLLNYNPWHVRDGGAWRPLEFVSGRPAARGFLVHLRTVDDRDSARALIGADVAVRRSQLPPA